MRGNMKIFNKQNSNEKFKKGGVSIFLVVAACLLVSVVVASFIRIMIRDQQQASAQDLSQSAYDSAQTGVEDAKRFYMKYMKDCNGGLNVTSEPCISMNKELNATNSSCFMLGSGDIGSKEEETKIQSSTNGKDELNQAYTCVKVRKDSPDFVGELAENGSSKVVPLRGTADFNKVKVSWFDSEDLGSNSKVSLENIASSFAIPTFPQMDSTNWPNARPALMRMQFAKINGSYDVNQLDNKFKDNETGSSTMFAYPGNGVNLQNSFDLNVVDNRSKDGRDVQPRAVKCGGLENGGYSCESTIDVGNITPDQNAFLRLTAMYNKSHFKVELLNKDNKVVSFNGVQPVVDSTGRANDNFRRVESRIEFVDPNFPMPDFSVEQTDEEKPTCKDFWVTKKQNGGVECKEN